MAMPNAFPTTQTVRYGPPTESHIVRDTAKLPPSFRSLAFVLALLAIAIAFWWWRILAYAPTAGPIGALCSDLYTSYIPVLSRAAQEIRQGSLPLWNPYQLGGVPVLPSWVQFGVFYPLNALFLVLPAHVALGWTACLHLVVAGAGMYWLAGMLGLSPAAARFAAVTCMLSQPIAVLPNLFTATTLAPAVLAAWALVVKTPTARTVALAAALLALQFSTGGIQIVVYTLYAIALLLPFLFFTGRPSGAQGSDKGQSPFDGLRANGESLVALILAAVLTTGLVAVLLLPTTVSVELSGRATGRLSLAETIPFPPPTAGELALQLIDPTPGLPRIFYGWAALALALLGVIAAPQRAVWAGVVSITLAGTLLVLATNTSVYELYYRLPTASWFRAPERAAMLVGIGVSLLAAFGIERLRNWGWRLTASLLVLLPIAELFHANVNYWLPYPQVRPAAAFAPPAKLDDIRSALDSGRTYIALNWQDRFPFMEKLGTWQRLPVGQDYDTLTPAVYGEYFRALLAPGALVDPIFAGRYHPLFGTVIARRALDMLAVKLVVVAPGAQVRWIGGQATAPPAGPLLIDNRNALPRAYAVHRVRVVETQDEALRAIAEPRFDPASTAVVIGGREIDMRDGDSSVAIESVKSDAITLRARMERPGLLILNDLMFPGWEATVDSVAARIFATNVLFRGVYLDAGEHVVEFTYRAPRLLLGAWISGVSFVVLVAMGVWGRRAASAAPL